MASMAVWLAESGMRNKWGFARLQRVLVGKVGLARLDYMAYGGAEMELQDDELTAGIRNGENGDVSPRSADHRRAAARHKAGCAASVRYAATILVRGVEELQALPFAVRLNCPFPADGRTKPLLCFQGTTQACARWCETHGLHVESACHCDAKMSIEVVASREADDSARQFCRRHASRPR